MHDQSQNSKCCQHGVGSEAIQPARPNAARCKGESFTSEPSRKLFARRLSETLEDAENGLTVRLRALLDRLRRRWRALDGEIDGLTGLQTDYARQSDQCQRASTVPGVSTTMVAAVGNAQAFRCGRDIAAWLGLVLKQFTTGSKPGLGPVSKGGTRQLRMLLIQGANALLLHMKRDQ